MLSPDKLALPLKGLSNDSSSEQKPSSNSANTSMSVIERHRSVIYPTTFSKANSSATKSVKHNSMFEAALSGSFGKSEEEEDDISFRKMMTNYKWYPNTDITSPMHRVTQSPAQKEATPRRMIAATICQDPLLRLQ